MLAKMHLLQSSPESSPVSSPQSTPRSSPRSSPRSGNWGKVDTSHLTVLRTDDMDLFRLMTRRSIAAPAPRDLMHGGPETIYMRDPNSGRWVTRTGQRNMPGGSRSRPFSHSHSMSSLGGPEGVFERDPETGRWTKTYLGK